VAAKRQRSSSGSPKLLVLYPYLEGFPAARIRAAVLGGRKADGPGARDSGDGGAASAGPPLRLVLADEPSPQVHPEGFDECLALPPPECFASAHERLRRWCGRSRPAGIFLQSEVALPMGALLARELGLPGPSVEAVHRCTNKYLSRLTLTAAGVPVPAFRLVEDAVQVRSFAREWGYPVVLKAVASAMSRLVTLVPAADRVDAAVTELLTKLAHSADLRRLVAFGQAAGLDLGCDPLRQFLVEHFEAGAALESDGLVVAGRPHPLGIIEQIPSSDPPFFFEGYLLPAELSSGDETEALRVSGAALAAVGLGDSGFAVEMRVQGGRATVIEVNGRLGLDDGFAEMLQLHSGIEPMLEAARIALGRGSPLVAAARGSVALAYRNCYREAVVRRLPCPEELRELETDGVRVRFGLATEEGRCFHAPPHPEAYPHLAWALALHPTSSRAAYDAARAGLGRLGICVAPA
jgi:hypothetical protein